MTKSSINILCLADLHNSKSSLRAINSHLSKHNYDLVLCAGDIASKPNPDAKQFLLEFIDIITEFHQTKLFLVHGNNETEAMIALLNRKKVLIHLQERRFLGYKFVGIGGWMEELLSPQKMAKMLKSSILLTHIPPKKPLKATAGSGARLIKGGPLIHLCGHFHAPGAVWRIGETLVIKIPPAMYGQAAVLKMPQKKIKFITL